MSVKAFELVPAIERLKLMSEKAHTKIVSLECCGKNVYLGTDDCFVIHYLVEEKQGPGGRMSFVSSKQGHKYLGFKKPVVELRAASALNRLMVLCDGIISLLNMLDLEPIAGGAKIKGVGSFCLNANPVSSSPFSVEVCVALSRKKCLQLYTVTEDRMQMTRELATNQVPNSLAMDGEYVCVAAGGMYTIINVAAGHSQELFPYDQDSLHPIITTLSREEFLLSAPSALGMFAMATGISQRPPLQWSDNLISVAYSHPYILALNDEFITVHSILDQQQKQSLPFQGGSQLGQFDGRIYVASSHDVYTLLPIPIDKQIEALMSVERVREALDLASMARNSGSLSTRLYQRVQQRAAFLEFAAQNFDEALLLFKDSNLDIRELMTLYPHLLPSNSDFRRAVPPLHNMADINQAARQDPHKVRMFKEFLLSYLQQIRGTNAVARWTKEVDTGLVKLYAELDRPSLVRFLENNCVECEDSWAWLERCDCHHAQALLHCSNHQPDKALALWTDIVDGKLNDDTFPGMKHIIDFLIRLLDADLVWTYTDWVLERDHTLGVQIFLERSKDTSTLLSPDLVLDHLKAFPQAVLVYLHHLVCEEKLKEEKYHTHLAVLLLDDVLHLLDGPADELSRAREKLQDLLQISNLYRVQLLLGKVKQTTLYQECAILYSKLEEHDKALRLLVHKVRNFAAAETYCVVNSEKHDGRVRKRLFHLLLSIYLDPGNERRDSMVGPAVSLLNSNKAHFDTAKVLELIPDNWSIGLLSQFLNSSIRSSLHQCRTTRIKRMVARGHHLQLKGQLCQVRQQRVVVGEDRVCAVCNRSLGEPTFIRFPNGILTHVACVKNKTICPVTGKDFSKSKDIHSQVTTQ